MAIFRKINPCSELRFSNALLARTGHAGRRLTDSSTAELRDRQGIFAIKSPASYRAPLFLFWLDP